MKSVLDDPRIAALAAEHPETMAVATAFDKALRGLDNYIRTCLAPIPIRYRVVAVSEMAGVLQLYLSNLLMLPSVLQAAADQEDVEDRDTLGEVLRQHYGTTAGIGDC